MTIFVLCLCLLCVTGLCIVLRLVCLLQCQEIGWEERLQNEMFRVRCKNLTQYSVLFFILPFIYGLIKKNKHFIGLV